MWLKQGRTQEIQEEGEEEIAATARPLPPLYSNEKVTLVEILLTLFWPERKAQSEGKIGRSSVESNAQGSDTHYVAMNFK